MDLMFSTRIFVTISLSVSSQKLYHTKKMKQKVVIRVDMSEHKKSRAKAMKFAATFPGVESVAIKGDAKDRIEVIGDEIDTVGLAKLLRKNVGHADLITVGPAKKDEKNNEVKIITPNYQHVYASNYPYGNYYYGGGAPTYQPVYEMRDSYNDPNCSIM